MNGKRIILPWWTELCGNHSISINSIFSIAEEPSRIRTPLMTFGWRRQKYLIIIVHTQTLLDASVDQMWHKSLSMGSFNKTERQKKSEKWGESYSLMSLISRSFKFKMFISDSALSWWIALETKNLSLPNILIKVANLFPSTGALSNGDEMKCNCCLSLSFSLSHYPSSLLRLSDTWWK